MSDLPNGEVVVITRTIDGVKVCSDDCYFCTSSSYANTNLTIKKCKRCFHNRNLFFKDTWAWISIPGEKCPLFCEKENTKWAKID